MKYYFNLEKIIKLGQVVMISACKLNCQQAEGYKLYLWCSWQFRCSSSCLTGKCFILFILAFYYLVWCPSFAKKCVSSLDDITFGTECILCLLHVLYINPFLLQKTARSSLYYRTECCCFLCSFVCFFFCFVIFFNKLMWPSPSST